MKYGYSDYSSVAFASADVILTGVLFHLQGGSALAEQALKRMKKSPTSLTHW
jgi:hypothetical protein